jgi:outer membrane protein assembly factor BamA
VLLFVAARVESVCAEPSRIEKIRFLGNDVTQEETMLLEMTIHEGDVINIHDIEQSVQYIMDLGIFEKISYYLEKNDFDENTDLVIIVTEPYYWYVLPTFKFNDNSELELGARLRWDNLFGYNHKLVIKATDKGTDKNVNEYQTEIRYTFPRFLLSRFSLSLIAKKEQRLDDDNVLGDQQEIKTDFGFNVRKWLNKRGISRGVYAGLGIDYQQQSNVALSSSGESDGDFDLIFYNFQLGRDRKHKYRYNRGGDSLDYTLQLSNEVTVQTLTYRRFKILNADEVANLNYLISVGYADDDVLGNAAFSLGGNTTLRGYEKDAFHGNAIVRGSIEYLTKFNNSPLVRKVVFIDAGDTQDSLSDFSFSSIKVGTGAGIRWKARNFVNLDIRLDIAYGFETKEFRLVIGSRNTF